MVELVAFVTWWSIYKAAPWMGTFQLGLCIGVVVFIHLYTQTPA